MCIFPEANALGELGPSQISSQGDACAAAAEPRWPIWSCSTGQDQTARLMYFQLLSSFYFTPAD